MNRRAFLVALPAATVGLAAGGADTASRLRSAGAARSVAPVVAGRLPLSPEAFSAFLREVVHLRVLEGKLCAPFQPWRSLCQEAIGVPVEGSPRSFHVLTTRKPARLAPDDRHQERDAAILRRIAQGCGVPHDILTGGR